MEISNFWYTVLLVTILPAGLWLYTSEMATRSFPTLHDKRILILTAHPDDEVMFFAPTILALTDPTLGNHVKLLCLSNGSGDGDGVVRRAELIKSAEMLGIRKDDVLCLDDPQLQDGPTVWPTAYISKMLLGSFAPGHAQIPSNQAPKATIDALITFDQHGVSSHPNHASCYDGARAFLNTLMSKHAGWASPLTVYALRSVSLPRKYVWILDAPITVVQAMSSLMFASDKDKKSLKAFARGEGGGKKGEMPTWLLYVNGIRSWNKAQRAMVTGHKSQMRWFRWGWVGIGRYLVVNDLRRIKVTAA